jgi:hypothetical protein
MQKDTIKTQSPPKTDNTNSFTKNLQQKLIIQTVSQGNKTNQQSNNNNQTKQKSTYSSITKAPAAKSGSWTPSSAAPAAIARVKRLWLQTSTTVKSEDIKSWTSNWNMVEGSLKLKHIVQKTYTNSFFVSFKSTSNIYKEYIPTYVKFSQYNNKNDPIEHDKRLQIKSLYLKHIGLDVKEDTVKKSIHQSFIHADTAKTVVIFIDAKPNSNGKCDYKNAYVKIVGKEINSTLAQSKNLPCKLFPWNYKLKIPTKSITPIPNNESKWSSFTPTDIKSSSNTSNKSITTTNKDEK